MSRDEVKAKQDREVVAGLARGLRVLEAFNRADRQMTLSEVARLTALSPAAARRSLRTLAQLGYVRAIDRHFLLSARVLALSSAYLRSADVESTLMPELRRIVSLFGDTAGIAVLVDRNILYVAHHCTPRGLRPVAGAGVTYPAYATSLGRTLLAYSSEAEIDRYFGTEVFEKHTRFTEINAKRLRASLRQIRKAGFGTVVDQLFYGVTSLSVPIFSPTGDVVAAINTSAYTGTTGIDDLIAIRLPELQRSSAQMTQILHTHPRLLQSLRPGSTDEAARLGHVFAPTNLQSPQQRRRRVK